MSFNQIANYTFASISAAALLWVLNFQWEIRARVLLALQGHTGVSLVSPTNAQSLKKSPGTFLVSRIVYKNRDLIGFLDTGGDFVKLGATGPNLGLTFSYALVDYLLFSLFSILSLAGMLLLVFNLGLTALKAFQPRHRKSSDSGP
jgi:hypothetical protein